MDVYYSYLWQKLIYFCRLNFFAFYVLIFLNGVGWPENLSPLMSHTLSSRCSSFSCSSPHTVSRLFFWYSSWFPFYLQRNPQFQPPLWGRWYIFTQETLLVFILHIKRLSDVFLSRNMRLLMLIVMMLIFPQVSLAALKSLQEMLQAGRSSASSTSGLPEDSSSPSHLNSPIPEDSIANWNTAWKVHLSGWDGKWLKRK